MTGHEQTDSFYTRWAGVYEHLARQTPGISTLRTRTVEAMGLEPGATVIDMGCGPGPNFSFLRTTVGPTGTVIGIDLAAGALPRAQRFVRSNDWTNVHPIRADARHPPVRSADAILATFVVGMFDDPVAAIDEWCNFVGPGGKIGLLHFAKSDGRYRFVMNRALEALVVVSTPGSNRRNRRSATLLDRRVRAAHDHLANRCTGVVRDTHWGGIIHRSTGTVAENP